MDDVTAIKEISRVTRVSGKVFTSIPNAYIRTPPVFWLPYILYDRLGGHLRHYKAENLVSHFQKSGLSLEQIIYQEEENKIYDS